MGPGWRWQEEGRFMGTFVIVSMIKIKLEIHFDGFHGDRLENGDLFTPG